MLLLNAQSIKENKKEFEAAAVQLPKFDHEQVVETTKKAPKWVHFGAGNIFRGFIAEIQHRLLDEGFADSGIIAVDTFDFDIIDKIFIPHDNMTMNVTLNPDGSTKYKVVASIAEGIRGDFSAEKQRNRLLEIFCNEGLQMLSFTITEKGYALNDAHGNLLPVVKADIKDGPEKAKHAMSVVTALMLARFKVNAAPMALVSVDNCSHNGEKLRNSVLTIAMAWHEKGFVEKGFVDYLSDENKVAFPWSMIDKITPRPDKSVEAALKNAGIGGMETIVTSKNTYIAAFVNAERPQYLVLEDRFPNGRPALEKAGVYMTDKDTVNKTERMKVTTCLNPLHTAMSVYGCMLGYTLICNEMKDEDIVALIKRLGYDEGLPVVVDPKILRPKEFIDEVIEQRLPNPFMPDAPQRIATDTSQKIAIRFGETIKSYVSQGLSLSGLKSIPLALAGWLRYLLGVDDEGTQMEVSSDPMKDELQKMLSGIEFGKPESYKGQLKKILANKRIFGVNLVELGLSDTIEEMFVEQLNGVGAVRACLKKHLGK